MPAWLLAPVTLPAWTLLAGDVLVLAEAAMVGGCLWALLRPRRHPRTGTHER